MTSSDQEQERNDEMMIEKTRIKDQLYLGAVIALLLLMSMLNGTVTVAIAAFLLVLGLVIYPEMRRTAVPAALIALAVAVGAVVVRTLF
jgi:O-antigen ligase